MPVNSALSFDVGRQPHRIYINVGGPPARTEGGVRKLGDLLVFEPHLRELLLLSSKGHMQILDWMDQFYVTSEEPKRSTFSFRDRDHCLALWARALEVARTEGKAALSGEALRRLLNGVGGAVLGKTGGLGGPGAGPVYLGEAEVDLGSAGRYGVLWETVNGRLYILEPAAYQAYEATRTVPRTLAEVDAVTAKLNTPGVHTLTRKDVYSLLEGYTRLGDWATTWHLPGLTRAPVE